MSQGSTDRSAASFVALSPKFVPYSGGTGAAFGDALAAEIRVIRQATLDAAFLANPNRFKNKRPQLPPMPTAVWINPPLEEKMLNGEPVGRTLN